MSESKYSEGLIVDLNEKIFFCLGKLSFFNLIRYIYKKILRLYFIKKENICCKCCIYERYRINEYISSKMHGFVDCWVLFNLICSMFLSYFLVNYRGNNKIWIYIPTIYAFMRVFEVVIYQINVNLFDIYRARKKGKPYSIKSPTRTVILLLNNYIELIFWFIVIAIGSVTFSGGKAQQVRNWTFCVRQSFICFVTLDYEAIFEIWFNKEFLAKSTLVYVGIIEVVSGLIMTIISLANFIGKLPSEYSPSKD